MTMATKTLTSKDEIDDKKDVVFNGKIIIDSVPNSLMEKHWETYTGLPKSKKREFAWEAIANPILKASGRFIQKAGNTYEVMDHNNKAQKKIIEDKLMNRLRDKKRPPVDVQKPVSKKKKFMENGKLEIANMSEKPHGEESMTVQPDKTASKPAPMAKQPSKATPENISNKMTLGPDDDFADLNPMKTPRNINNNQLVMTLINHVGIAVQDANVMMGASPNVSLDHLKPIIEFFRGTVHCLEDVYAEELLKGPILDDIDDLNLDTFEGEKHDVLDPFFKWPDSLVPDNQGKPELVNSRSCPHI